MSDSDGDKDAGKLLDDLLDFDRRLGAQCLGALSSDIIQNLGELRGCLTKLVSKLERWTGRDEP